MDTDRAVRCLAALMNVVAARALDGRGYAVLVAACPEPLPRFAHDLADLVRTHPEVEFPAAKITGALQARIDRLQAPPLSTTSVQVALEPGRCPDESGATPHLHTTDGISGSGPGDDCACAE